MTDEKNPFFDQEDESKDESQNPKVTPEEIREVNRELIEISHVSGPLVIFFGPREIGKTVTLLRLCSYIEGEYQITPVEHFRSDQDYIDAIDKFEAIRRGVLAPDATGDINFMLLDISETTGKSFCQILEAPGEHFFDIEDHKKFYPRYLNEIFSGDIRKVFVFFYEVGLFNNTTHRMNYVEKFVKLINEQIHSNRDRIIILCNKCDLQPHVVDGKPVIKEFRKKVFDDDAFLKLKNLIIKSNFKHVHFVPFSSGKFNLDKDGKKVFAKSSDHYPSLLWDAIFDCVRGGSKNSGCLGFLRRLGG